jgi:hypothetical protein
MRFCPFCSAENADESAVCAACGRRLPPLPPRRAGSKGPPTGISLPPRQTGAPPLSRKPPTMPPPIPSQGTSLPAPPPTEATVVDPWRQSAPSLPPPPVDDTWVGEQDPGLAQLRNAIAPGPAAERREAPPPEPRAGGEPTRRKNDSKAPPLPAPLPRPGTSGAIPTEAVTFDRPKSPAPLPPVDRAKSPAPLPPLDRAKSPVPDRAKTPSVPPPDRAKTPSQPGPDRAKPPSVPPPDRAKTPSQPPPGRSKSPSMPPPFTGRAPSHPPSFGSKSSSFGGETEIEANPYALQVAESASRPLHTPTGVEPPPTRIHRGEALVDRPFTPQKVNPIPEIPEPGLVTAARYAYQFALARWQRRGAIKTLGVEIKQDTEALDQVLGALGRAARGARVEGRVFSAENAAITAAEERVASLQKDSGELDGRKAEENSKFVDVERERNQKLVEAERMVEEAQRELQHLEAQRRSLRDKRKELDRRQKAFLKNADDHDRQAGAAPLGDQRQELRRVAEGHRKEAAALEPDKQDIDRRLVSLERPISEATARLDAAKAELDASKRSLSDAREGHTHRLAELDAEQKRKSREVGLAEAEILRRLVTLGTLVNLNRIEDPQFAELYQRIDRIRGAITARTTEIEKLTAEREAFDRGTLVRGVATIGGAFVALIALIVILRAVL